MLPNSWNNKATQPKTPQTWCKLRILSALCNLPSRSRIKSVDFIKLHQVCEHQICCNLIFADLLQVDETTCIKPACSSQLTGSLLTTCNRLVIIKSEQAMRTHYHIVLVIGPVCMRPERRQTGMKIEIVSMFTWDRYENHKSFVLFSCLPLLFFYSSLSSMRCSEAERPTETSLKCICVHIHPALDSSRSEDSQLGPAGGMTSNRSENF